MCVQGLAGEPEKADDHNVSSPPKNTSDTGSLSSGVLSVDQEVGGSDQCVDGSVSIEHTTVQLCDHRAQNGSCEDSVVLHRVGVGGLDATQLVQLLLGHLALGNELFGTRGDEIVARVDVVVDAIAGLLEAGGGEHIAEQEVGEEELGAVVGQGCQRVVGGEAEVGEERRPVRIGLVFGLLELH
jgi:hypothetical protein